MIVLSKMKMSLTPVDNRESEQFFNHITHQKSHNPVHYMQRLNTKCVACQVKESEPMEILWTLVIWLLV